MAENSIPSIAIQLYELLAPLSSDERINATRAALAMHGDDFPSIAPSYSSVSGPASDERGFPGGKTFGPNAERWVRQNDLRYEDFDEIFDLTGSDVALLAADVPGNTKKDKTGGCYLLVGVANLLRSDEPLFYDEEAVEFCKYVGAYDANNHTANRKAIGNRIIGDRKRGFKLTSPGLREAASIIKSLRPISLKPR
jgi:hypothetical protein